MSREELAQPTPTRTGRRLYPETPSRTCAPPYSPECEEGGFSEVGLPLYGVLRSSPPASNTKQQQRYAVWAMCHTLQSCYATSQQSRQRPRTASRTEKVGTYKGAWGASSATGCLLSPLRTRGGRGRRDRCELFATYLTHPPLLTLTYARKRKDRPDEAHHSVVGHHGPDPAGGKRAGTGGGDRLRHRG